MRHLLLGTILRVVLAGMCLFRAVSVYAGGSGLNTVVVINQSSSNSFELGNYYCEKRQIPPENVLFMSWVGSVTTWSNGDLQTNLVSPLLSMLANRQLTNQIDYVVLSMDIPYQTTDGSNYNSTTSAMFYGWKTDSGLDWLNITNSYEASEQIFRNATPASASGYSFLCTMLTGDTLPMAKQLVDQGVSSDGTFPTQNVILAKSSDEYRNVRYHAFDNAIFNAQLIGKYGIVRTNCDSPLGLTNLLGFETGLYQFTISPNSFVPGAMADSLTSYGGLILGPNDQTTLMALISAGAAGSYGTITEPSPNPEKFPDPQTYFYQARGFSLAECYYQSIVAPYEGLIVGEALAAPFARPGSGGWVGVSSNAVLIGIPQLSLQFSAADSDHPLQQIDLFVDGKFSRTLTNVPPAQGNLLKVRLNSSIITYAVPTNATLASIASGLAAQVNQPANTNLTQVIATAFGDRVEFQSLSSNRVAPPGHFHVSGQGGALGGGSNAVPPFAMSFAGGAAATSTLLSASRDTFMDSSALGVKAVSVNGTMQVGTWLQLDVTKVNGKHVVVGVTNQTASGTPYTLVSQLYDAINSASGLQGGDGIQAEDLMTGFFGAGQLNLFARAPGLGASSSIVTLTAPDSLALTPSASTPLNDNISDLQPRNHVYVRAGLTNLAVSFPLDTTQLPDGYHDLTAVAYEGSHVHTQTRVSIPVRVQNTSLSATMSLVDLADPSPVQGTYHIQVSANTNAVRTIRLFSTGGELASVTNQPSPTFNVAGPSLGVGLHPFYAIVETSAGLKYRTQTRWVHLASGQ
jgi:uncharacterized protein (TIGR03790 family)